MRVEEDGVLSLDQEEALAVFRDFDFDKAAPFPILEDELYSSSSPAPSSSASTDGDAISLEDESLVNTPLSAMEDQEILDDIRLGEDLTLMFEDAPAAFTTPSTTPVAVPQPGLCVAAVRTPQAQGLEAYAFESVSQAVPVPLHYEEVVTTTSVPKRQLQEPSTPSAAEIKRLKRDIRLMKNRESANRSRMRRKELMNALEDENKELRQKISELNGQVAAYKAESETLKRHNRLLESLLTRNNRMPAVSESEVSSAVISQKETAVTGAGAVLFAVVFSVSLFSLSPYLEGEGADGSVFTSPMRRGRVLQVMDGGDPAASSGLINSLPCLSILAFLFNSGKLFHWFTRGSFIFLSVLFAFFVQEKLSSWDFFMSKCRDVRRAWSRNSQLPMLATKDKAS